MTGLHLAARIRDHAMRTPDGIAIREKRFGLWQTVTWASYWEQSNRIANGLLACGVAPGDRVAIHSENRPEWLYADIATVAIRATSVGLYPTNPAAEVHHILQDSGASILVAEDQEQVDKALAVADALSELRWIVYVDPRGIRGRYDDPRLLSWDELGELGDRHAAAYPDAVAELLAGTKPSDIATLVYTSGTTGPPKGAMLSSHNITFVMDRMAAGDFFAEDPPAGERDLTLSYLPLCHVAERAFTTWMNAAAGTEVNFAEAIETVQQNLREIQPTLILGVPRIWEKLLTSVHTRMSGATWFKRKNYALWMSVSSWIGRRLVANRGRHTVSTRLVYAIGWLAMYRSLREKIGCSHVRYAASGAAPIAPEVLEFFMGIGIPMFELFGMTESSAYGTGNRKNRVILGTVGEPLKDCELRLDELTGEILLRHPGVFVGYWNNPAETARTIDAEGWLHTGDVGEMVEGTHLRITDRLKDLIITAGGKNVAPSEIENALKASPYIKEAAVIGDGRRYLTALIGIELDSVGDWAQRQRIAYTTYRDLTTKQEVVMLVSGVVDDVNTRFAQVETIKKFRLLPKELDHEEGELTATLKIKRAALADQFADLIEGMYAGSDRA